MPANAALWLVDFWWRHKYYHMANAELWLIESYLRHKLRYAATSEHNKGITKIAIYLSTISRFILQIIMFQTSTQIQKHCQRQMCSKKQNVVICTFIFQNKHLKQTYHPFLKQNWCLLYILEFKDTHQPQSKMWIWSKIQMQ